MYTNLHKSIIVDFMQLTGLYISNVVKVEGVIDQTHQKQQTKFMFNISAYQMSAEYLFFRVINFTRKQMSCLEVIYSMFNKKSLNMLTL